MNIDTFGTGLVVSTNEVYTIVYEIKDSVKMGEHRYLLLTAKAIKGDLTANFEVIDTYFVKPLVQPRYVPSTIEVVSSSLITIWDIASSGVYKAAQAFKPLTEGLDKLMKAAKDKKRHIRTAKEMLDWVVNVGLDEFGYVRKTRLDYDTKRDVLIIQICIKEDGNLVERRFDVDPEVFQLYAKEYVQKIDPSMILAVFRKALHDPKLEGKDYALVASTLAVCRQIMVREQIYMMNTTRPDRDWERRPESY